MAITLLNSKNFIKLALYFWFFIVQYNVVEWGAGI